MPNANGKATPRTVYTVNVAYRRRAGMPLPISDRFGDLSKKDAIALAKRYAHEQETAVRLATVCEVAHYEGSGKVKRPRIVFTCRYRKSDNQLVEDYR